MNRPVFRSAILYALLTGSIFLVDIAIDRLLGGDTTLDLPHILFSAITTLVAYILLSRAMEVRGKAETALRQSRDELEKRVFERTTELEYANNELKKEIVERQLAKIELEKSMEQVEEGRARAEALAGELQLANNMMQTLIETLPVGMVLVSQEGELTLANSRARKVLGGELEISNFSLIAHNLKYHADGTQVSPEELPLNRALRYGETTTGMEILLVRGDGSEVFILLSASPVHDDSGQIISAVEVLQDITGIKQMQLALRRSEENYRTQYDVFPEPTTVYDRSGVLLMQNLVSARNLGGKRDDFIGKSIIDLFGPAAAGYKERMDRVIDTGITEYHEDMVNLPSGRRHFWTCMQRVPLADGQYGVQILSYDITDRKLAEEKVAASQKLLQDITDNSPSLVYALDLEGRFLLINRGLESVLGVPRETALGKTREGSVAPELAAVHRANDLLVITERRPLSFEEETIESDGFHTYLTVKFPLIDIRGGIYGIGGISTDITNRMLVEDALRNSEEKFATVFQFSPDAIIIIRLADSQVIDVNEAFTRTWGQPRSEAVGKSWRDLNIFQSVEDQKKVGALFVEKGKIIDYELSFSIRGNNNLTALVSLIPITIRGDACILGITHDISERKGAEEALRNAQAALAQGIQERASLQERQRLARELHDSVSQALYGISLGTHTALALFDSDRPKVLEALNYILSLTQAGLAEMRSLIFELRPESLEMEGLVTALSKQAAAVYARYGIEVEMRLCEEPEVGLPIKEALYRISQEALQNAVKHARARRLDVQLTYDTDSLCLEVQDDGIGFDPQDSFPGHLGLRSMRERASSVGGSLDITSAPQKGTKILARVPLNGESPVNKK